MPSRFTGPLTITELDVDVRCWRLEAPLVYEVAALGSGREIAVPVGYVTDGASVPRPLWAILPPWGRYSRPAVVHDLLCTMIEKGTPHKEAPSRRVADAIFFEAMGVTGVNKLVRWALWLGVRIGSVVPGHARNYAFD